MAHDDVQVLPGPQHHIDLGRSSNFPTTCPEPVWSHRQVPHWRSFPRWNYLVGGIPTPSEKNESQLGLFIMWQNKKCSKPPTSCCRQERRSTLHHEAQRGLIHFLRDLRTDLTDLPQVDLRTWSGTDVCDSQCKFDCRIMVVSWSFHGHFMVIFWSFSASSCTFHLCIMRFDKAFQGYVYIYIYK